MNPLTKEIRTRNGWHRADHRIASNYPGKREALFGKHYSQLAYVPKTNATDDDSLVLYRVEWPGFGIGRSASVHYAYELWHDGRCIMHADTMREVTGGLYAMLLEKVRRERATA